MSAFGSRIEAKLQPARAVGNINAEINEMTSSERNSLRDFLLFLKSGGQPVDECFEELKLAADNAVYAARERLGEAI
jgi:hypothetical protein